MDDMNTIITGVLAAAPGIISIILFFSNRRDRAKEEGKKERTMELLTVQVDAAHEKIRDVKKDIASQSARITLQNEQLITMVKDIEYIKSGISELKEMLTRHEERDR